MNRVRSIDCLWRLNNDVHRTIECASGGNRVVKLTQKQLTFLPATNFGSSRRELLCLNTQAHLAALIPNTLGYGLIERIQNSLFDACQHPSECL